MAVDPATVILALKTAQTVAKAMIGIIDAIEEIKKGDPNKVDLQKLKEELLALSDLPELHEEEEDSESKNSETA